MSIEKILSSITADGRKAEAKSYFQKLIQQNAYVGELYSITYETARVVVIHDFQRRNAGGILSLSFLIATRIDTINADDINLKCLKIRKPKEYVLKVWNRLVVIFHSIGTAIGLWMPEQETIWGIMGVKSERR
jgi:hypothetical protein